MYWEKMGKGIVAYRYFSVSRCFGWEVVTEDECGCGVRVLVLVLAECVGLFYSYEGGGAFGFEMGSDGSELGSRGRNRVLRLRYLDFF